MNYGLRRLTDLSLSLRLVRELHRELMLGVRGEESAPGDFRHSQNWIGPAGSTLRDARFVPPSPHELLRVLGEWETFLHAMSEPVLVTAALAHAQFETIHPFLNGSGSAYSVRGTEPGKLYGPRSDSCGYVWGYDLTQQSLKDKDGRNSSPENLKRYARKAGLESHPPAHDAVYSRALGERGNRFPT